VRREDQERPQEDEQNCTTNLFALVENPPRDCAALEVFLRGFSARYFYRQGGFAGHLSFEELRPKACWVTRP
jgi:hypothetical protein